MDERARIALSILGAYGIGSIPIGYLIARRQGIDDIRRYGSGAIGATNVGRLLGPRYFVLVFFLDAIKAYGYLELLTFWDLSRVALLLCSGALLFGNSYPLFLRGAAGKGVATMAGIMYALNPFLCSVLLVTWLITFGVVGIVGIASVITALLLPLYALLLTDTYGLLFMIIVAVWVIWRHRVNIRLFYLER
jgi:glycerol-3-phosphate acyltransferase PlsY